MSILSLYKNVIDETDFEGGVGSPEVEGAVDGVRGYTDTIVGLRPENTILFILSELITASNTVSGWEFNSSSVNDLQMRFLETEYPGINAKLRVLIKNWLEGFKVVCDEESLDFREQIKGLLLNSPETIIKTIISEAGIDFTRPAEMGLKRSKNMAPDIPVTVKKAQEAGVGARNNATIGMLKDDLGQIVANPRILEVLAKNFGIDLSDNVTVSNVLSYQPGFGMPVFIEAMKLLISREEKFYQWPDLDGNVSEPLLVPGGTAGIAAYATSFVSEGDLVILPNRRWTNVDGIFRNVTKVPPATTNMITDGGNISFYDLEQQLRVAVAQGRKKVHIYLNFPNNPTGVNMSETDAVKLNKVLQKPEFRDLHIGIVSDDPYGAFSYNKSGKETVGAKLTTPLTYLLDSRDNVDVFELGSHGTKEAGVYGLRTGLMRIITSDPEKTKKLELYMKGRIRELFSMSVSISQILFIKAIMGDDIDPFNLDIKDKDESRFGKLLAKLKDDPEELERRIQVYLDGRDGMMAVVLPKLEEMRKAVTDQCFPYLVPMTNPQTEGIFVGGFMISFTLSDDLIKKGITEQMIVDKCISYGSDGAAFCAFDDQVRDRGVLRMSLIAGDTEEFAIVVNKGIKALLEE